MSALYEFRNILYSAPPREAGADSVSIIKDATFQITRGVFSVITGPSGSGKSTLLRLFNRLADPTSGTILFDGKDIREYPVIDLRRMIGWVPQVPVRFPGTVRDNLNLPFTISQKHKIPQEEIDNSILELMDLNLLRMELLDRRADDLSVGEAQRLNLLRALALKPEVLLLDEPTSALDPDASDALLAQIERIQRERNLTTIMVSHRPDEVEKVGEMVFQIKNGEVRAGG